ncbi:MAG TPA: hypothetical protein VE932_09580 [Patescibacteria group bacterium]|nr:hypothetical protein [Patescibacteria group bacterium]
MKKVLIDRYGPPEEVARCAEVPDVGAPGAGEVVFDVLAFPINPADVSFCRGADACAVDGDDLAETVKAQTGGAPIRLGLDAVSGWATARLSARVAEGGGKILVAPNGAI